MTEGAIHSTWGAMLRRQADTFGDKVFLSFEGTDYSFAELDAHTNIVAHSFRDRLGIEKGDHVALLLGNCREFLFTVFALAKLGGVAVPLNTAAKGELLEYFLRQSKSKVLIVGHDLLDRAAPVVAGISGIEHVVVAEAEVGTLEGDAIDFAALVSDDASPPDTSIDYRDPMFLMYTSGTTGPSKGVISPHSQSLSVAAQVACAYGYDADDILFTCLPLFHANSLWYSFLPALICGARIVISRRFSGSAFWDEVTACGATQTNTLGAMANIALKELKRLDSSKLQLRQMMVVPGLNQATAKPLTDLGIKLTSLFAQTETFAVTLHGPDEPSSKMGSAGRARDHVTVCILDDDDKILPPGEVGEIAVRPMAPNIMMTGYFEMPVETLEAMTTLWFHSGDRGYLDDDGYLYFVDRKKDAIRRRGENISAYELEMILCQHDTIREAAAVAVPSDLGEDDVLVYVVLEDGCTFDPEGIVQFCDTNMPYFMVPRYLETLPELPKTGSEKTEKYKLRDWAAERMTDLWDREALGIKLSR